MKLKIDLLDKGNKQGIIRNNISIPCVPGSCVTEWK